MQDFQGGAQRFNLILTREMTLTVIAPLGTLRREVYALAKALDVRTLFKSAGTIAVVMAVDPTSRTQPVADWALVNGRLAPLLDVPEAFPDEAVRRQALDSGEPLIVASIPPGSERVRSARLRRALQLAEERRVPDGDHELSFVAGYQHAWTEAKGILEDLLANDHAAE